MQTAEILIKQLNIGYKEIIAIVGSGGKTTLMRQLAEKLAVDMRVGLGTTTKIKYPHEETYDALYINGDVLPERIEKNGIYYFADEGVGDNKLSGLTNGLAAYAREKTDILILEADGSKRLPLKGWANFEPVIDDDTTITIGVLPLFVLGCPAASSFIHRFPLFQELTGIQIGEPILTEHLYKIITDAKGLFKGSRGRKVLLLNQVTAVSPMEAAAGELIEQTRHMVDFAVIGYKMNLEGYENK